MRKKKFLLLLAAGMTVMGLHAGSQSSATDLETVRNRVVYKLFNANVNVERVRELVSTINPDGSWPGIDYTDTSRIAFQHTRHLSNLNQMSLAYKKKGSPLAGNKALKKAFSSALDFWLKKDFICENWWHNEIGTPMSLTSVLLVMDKDLTKEQIEKTLNITHRANIDAWGARQSGDRILIAGIQAQNALFKRDAGEFEMLVGVIESEIRFVSFDQRGLQYDYSFHHRDDKVNNTLTYGLQYADVFAEWVELLGHTKYSFKEGTLRLLIDYYLDGICKMLVYGKYPDMGATNRDITRRGHGHAYSSVTPERLTGATDYRKADLQYIIDIRNDKIAPSRSFDAFFWLSEFYVHQRPSYYASVRMFSTRVCNMEEPYNGEGLTNHHRGDGVNYLSLVGDEFNPLTPVYDWQKIPGATILRKPSLPPESQIQKWGVMDFAGAATDGSYGVVGFDFISPHDPVKARKSWFFFDNEYVCLGAGVSSRSPLPLATTVEQCALKGDVTVGTPDYNGILPVGIQEREGVTGWVFHAGVGYVFPQPMHVVLSNMAQKGSWSLVTTQVGTSRDEISKDVFKLWIDHGKFVRNGSYSYIVIPASTVEKVRAAASDLPVTILSNTSDLQAVWHKNLNMLQAVFYRTGAIEFADGIRLELDSPGIIMVRTENGRVKEITVSDPERKSGKISFSLNRKISLGDDKARVVHGDGNDASLVSVVLPQGDFAGSSVVVRIKD